MKRWLFRGAIALAVLLALWLLKATVFASKPIEVRVHTVETGLVEDTVTNSRAGTVKARRRAKLSPETGGQVVAIPFREGDAVLKGDVVLRLDDRSQQAQLVLSRREHDAVLAERTRACLAADRARRESERVARLAAEQIVSVDLLDQAESAFATATAACEAARAQASRAEASVALAAAELEKTVLQAPFDGVIAERSIEIGEWTTPSPPGLYVPSVLDILDPSSIYISAPMDEVDSARIRSGLEARVTIDSHRGTDFAGHVTRVAPYVLDIQEQNRTVDVEVELDDSTLATEFLPGTSADIEVILTSKSDVLRVPTGALMDGMRVLVLEGNVLEEREVEAGIRNWNFTEVVSGLEGGEKVVLSLDQPEIRDGAEAEVAAEDDAD